MSTERFRGWAAVVGGIRDWWREASRSYCERAVRSSLAEAPLGGHDWFLDAGAAR